MLKIAKTELKIESLSCEPKTKITNKLIKYFGT